jgi:hypothetical protein
LSMRYSRIDRSRPVGSCDRRVSPVASDVGFCPYAAAAETRSSGDDDDANLGCPAPSHEGVTTISSAASQTSLPRGAATQLPLAFRRGERHRRDGWPAGGATPRSRGPCSASSAR